MMSRFPNWFQSESERQASGYDLTPLPELHHRENLLEQLQTASFTDQPRSSAAVCLRPAGRPLMVAIPRAYEPGYAYPLLIWLHGEGRTESELERIMPQMTDRNFFGLGFRGNASAATLLPGGRTWQTDDSSVEDFCSQLHDVVCQLRQEYHIHSERIFIGGFGTGAEMALSALLTRPEWFAGGVALGGMLPDGYSVASSYDALRHKRVLLGTGARDSRTSAESIQATSQLLNCTGVSVTSRIWRGGHELTTEMLNDINQWVMESIFSSVG
ncbi:MAG: hypothetical protein KDA79_16600 [Planctomycetaceae bacterium]|nr:hypothetical protein [Planctomycetaceae bacterium]